MSPAKPAERDYITAIEDKITALSIQLDKRIESERQAVSLALTAAEKTTAIAQNTADKAVARAEAAASKEYLEAQITGLRDALTVQIANQKDAISAALTAVKEALTAAHASSEKAIHKAEESTEKRFQSVNEFRAQLGDQQKTFVTKAETEYKFIAIDKRFDEFSMWSRGIDIKFGGYVNMDTWNSYSEERAVWRRSVDAALTEARSKSSVIYSLIAISIALGGLLIATFNFFGKS